MSLCCEPAYRLVQPPNYDQVLTGALPYDNNDGHTVAGHIRDGLRPPHPTDLSHNRWLRYPVWDVITIGWSNKPEHRCEVFVVYQVFSKSSLTVESAHLERTNAREEDSLGPGGAQDAEQGDLTTQNERDLTIADISQTSKQGLSNAGNSFHGSPLSSNPCAVRSPRFRGVLMKWTRCVLPRFTPSHILSITSAVASREPAYVQSGATKVVQ